MKLQFIIYTFSQKVRLAHYHDHVSTIQPVAIVNWLRLLGRLVGFSIFNFSNYYYDGQNF